MFPYAKEHVQEFLENNWDTDQVQADVEALREQVTNVKV